MKLRFVATLANEAVRLRFSAMERSLRATGCRLPLRVIPYDDARFTLPPNAEWWEDFQLFGFLAQHRAKPVMRKYICLTASEYQFVDADVIFLRNPEEALASVSGWIVSCGSWRDPAHILTPRLRRVLGDISTLGQQRLFNSGQFASDRELYTRGELEAALLDPSNIDTALRFPYHEQPGLNLLVNLACIPLVNLTLPPWSMESTWAGDYGEDPKLRWCDPARKPYLIHWAGQRDFGSRPIDKYFWQWLTHKERAEFIGCQQKLRAETCTIGARSGEIWRRLKRGLREAISILRTGKTTVERARMGNW